MKAFRVADRRFPLFDGTGARLLGGRWNSPGKAIIYAAETYAGALLEILVHSNLGRVPSKHAAITIDIPDTVAVEKLAVEDVPRWNSADMRTSRAWGDLWLEEQRSAVLLVPSMVTNGREQNVLINPQHPESAHIQHSEPQSLRWDERLFQRR